MDWRGTAGGLWTLLHTFCHSTDRAGAKREEARMILFFCEEREGCLKPPCKCCTDINETAVCVSFTK